LRTPRRIHAKEEKMRELIPAAALFASLLLRGNRRSKGGCFLGVDWKRGAGGGPIFKQMDEIHLWQWRYTDQFGKRRIFPCRLSEEAAKRLRDAEKIQDTLEIRKPLGSTSDWQRSK
jgi:hypothetical protein